jgi:hypothetical protein
VISLTGSLFRSYVFFISLFPESVSTGLVSTIFDGLDNYPLAPEGILVDLVIGMSDCSSQHSQKKEKHRR